MHILTPEHESALIKKVQTLSTAIRALNSHVKKMEKILDLTKGDLSNTSHTTIKRLMLEFHTGGNIRVEEGNSSDVWYNSCIDLVQSRLSMKKKCFKEVRVLCCRFALHWRMLTSLCLALLTLPLPFSRRIDCVAQLYIGGVRVNRITRIHNRFLRHRFESAVREILESETSRDNEASASGGQHAVSTASASNSSSSSGGQNASSSQVSLPHDGASNDGASIQGKLSCRLFPRIIFLYLIHAHLSLSFSFHLQASSKVPKRMLEYLFYSSPPKLTKQTGQSDEIVRVAEDGFRSPREYKSLGFDESIMLHSTLDGADEERLKSLVDIRKEEESMQQRQRQSQWYSDGGIVGGAEGGHVQPPITGQMLLVKTFVGKRTEILPSSSHNGGVSNYLSKSNSAYQVVVGDKEEDRETEKEKRDAENTAASTSSKVRGNPAKAPSPLVHFRFTLL